MIHTAVSDNLVLQTSYLLFFISPITGNKKLSNVLLFQHINSGDIVPTEMS